jgi:predicted MFS family arabinose efflux permease
VGGGGGEVVRFVAMGLVGWVTSGRHRTTLLLSLAFILAHADEMLLPGVYREIALVLHVSPVGLGTLTFIRSFFQSTCSPFAAYAAVNHNRVSVIALGAILWALATYAAGLSTSYEQVAKSQNPKSQTPFVSSLRKSITRVLFLT